MSLRFALSDVAKRFVDAIVTEMQRPIAKAATAAIEIAVKAPADGHTLLLVGPPNAINASLYDRLNYNFIRDIVPIAGIAAFPTSWWSTHRSPSKQFPTSSLTQKPIQAR